jgi:hypothetical protein
VSTSGSWSTGKANIGPADEVGTEFAANIEGITIGSPEFVVLDKAGREYAMSANTFVGDKLQCDDGFDCLVKGTVKKVLGDAEGLPVHQMRRRQALPLRPDRQSRGACRAL